MTDNTKFRNANIKDAQLLFEWANEESTRNNSFNSSKIDYDSHIEWLKNKLEDKNYYILIYNDGKNEIGLCRLQINSKEALISYSIDVKFRGRGYGKKLIEKAEEFISKLAVNRIVAKVKSGNIASKKIFESLGYYESETNNEITYIKDVK